MSLLYNDATLTILGKVVFFSGCFFVTIIIFHFRYSNVKVGVYLARILDKKVLHEISKYDFRKSSLIPMLICTRYKSNSGEKSSLTLS